jgi:hypothetical protein
MRNPNHDLVTTDIFPGSYLEDSFEMVNATHELVIDYALDYVDEDTGVTYLRDAVVIFPVEFYDAKSFMEAMQYVKETLLFNALSDLRNDSQLDVNMEEISLFRFSLLDKFRIVPDVKPYEVRNAEPN